MKLEKPDPGCTGMALPGPWTQQGMPKEGLLRALMARRADAENLGNL